MKTVTLYGNATCPYCGAARMLLTKKGVPFTNIDVGSDTALRSEMEERSSSRTVPQIFIEDTHIGGFDELYALDKSGELDRILAA
jgi:glutaredoxin 3